MRKISKLQISDFAITHISAHENGVSVACSDANGDVYIIELSDNLSVSLKNDRFFLSNMLEFEAQREKILEGRLRELKLREKQGDEPAADVQLDEDEQLNETGPEDVNDEFFAILIEEEKRRKM